MVSSITGDGIEEMWMTMQKHVERMKVSVSLPSLIASSPSFVAESCDIY